VTIDTVTRAKCQVCGPLEAVGRRSLDSTAEKHTKDTGHATEVWTVPVTKPPLVSDPDTRDPE
jgi:hypothetical protein